MGRKGQYRGGGVAMMSSKHSITLIGTPKGEVKKNIWIYSSEVPDQTKFFEILGIYRPPGKNTVSQFLNELCDLLEVIRPSASSLLILGDFNIPINLKDKKTEVDDFIQTMTALGFFSTLQLLHA